jgi:hypothetical protein
MRRLAVLAAACALLAACDNPNASEVRAEGTWVGTYAGREGDFLAPPGGQVAFDLAQDDEELDGSWWASHDGTLAVQPSHVIGTVHQDSVALTFTWEPSTHGCVSSSVTCAPVTHRFLGRFDGGDHIRGHIVGPSSPAVSDSAQVAGAPVVDLYRQ